MRKLYLLVFIAVFAKTGWSVKPQSTIEVHSLIAYNDFDLPERDESLVMQNNELDDREGAISESSRIIQEQQLAIKQLEIERNQFISLYNRQTNAKQALLFLSIGLSFVMLMISLTLWFKYRKKVLQLNLATASNKKKKEMQRNEVQEVEESNHKELLKDKKRIKPNVKILITPESI